MFDIKLLDKNKEYVIAVSGGVDSVVFAHLLHKLRYKIKVFHFNHGFQSINNMMEFTVKEMCKDLGIESLYDYNKEHVATDCGESTENILRGLRLAAYKKLNSDIIVCHHLNDCVESYLMRCFDGTPEYAPIPPVTLMSNDKWIIRPFMLNKKDKIIEYCNFHGLSKYVVEDPTNKDISYRRNHIRNIVIPAIPNTSGLETVVKKRMIKHYSNCELRLNQPQDNF